MKGSFTLHIFHVSGKRMIASGIDGLSWGDKTEGVSHGENMLNFIPLQETPIERSPGVHK